MPKRFDNDLKIILYDEIKMLKVWIEIELLCNKKKKLKIHIDWAPQDWSFLEF